MSHKQQLNGLQFTGLCMMVLGVAGIGGWLLTTSPLCHSHPSTGAAAEVPIIDVPMDAMTLRDWFAGQYLMGRHTLGPNDRYRDDMSRRAYEAADAMLRARVLPD